MTIIDAHMHVDLGGFDPDRIVAEMDRKGVEASWLLTWEELSPPVPAVHTDLPPGPLLEASSIYPGRLVPFYAPDPASPELEKRFDLIREKGLSGCGELKVSRRWEDPLIERYLSLVQDHGLALVFHMENPRLHYLQEGPGFFDWMLERLMNDKFNGWSRYYLTRFSKATGILRRKIERNRVEFPGILYDLAGLEQRLRQFPGIRFVGHGPDFWNYLGAGSHPRYIHQKGPVREFGIIDRLLEQYDNLYCDVSGTSGYNALRRDREKSAIFLQKHARKILYGTDNTRFPLLELLNHLVSDPSSLERILCRNAMEVLDPSL